jgi:hypothetical protein
MMKTGFGVFLFLMPAFAFASGWDCRNNDMEITCASEKCAASSDFTPMDIGFNDHGSMTICAYSGCWEGKGKVFKSGDHILISGHKLGWHGTTHGSGDFMIALDKSTGIAVINGEGIAMPLICNPGNMGKLPRASK